MNLNNAAKLLEAVAHRRAAQADRPLFNEVVIYYVAPNGQSQLVERRDLKGNLLERRNYELDPSPPTS